MRRFVVRFRPVDWYAIAAAFTALPLIVPFLQFGIPQTDDAENHMHRIVSVLVNLENGYWWPRWTPYLFQQYGYPLHNFHPPGMYIAQALVYLITHASIVSIFTGTQALATLLYPLGAYLFARTFTGRPGALVAAVAYLYAPLRFRELWIQSDVPQFIAMMLLPWLLWAINKAAQHRRHRLRWSLITAVILAGLIVTHHSTTYLAVPLVGIYLLLLIFTRSLAYGWSDARRAAIAVFGGLILGTALATVYWLPALAEINDIQIRTIQGSAFDVQRNFIPLPELLSSAVPIDRSLLNWQLADGVDSVRIGLPQFIAALIGLLALIPIFRRSFRVKWQVVIGAGGMALCLFLMTPAASSVWRIIPLASQIQFPWRLLGDAGVLILPGAAILPALFPLRWRSWIAGAAVAIYIIAVLPLYYAPLNFSSVPSPSPATEIAHESQTSELATTTADEYLPRWVTTIPTAGFQTQALRDQSAAALNTLEWHVWVDDSSLPDGAVLTTETPLFAGSSRYQITTPAAFTLQFHQMYFPGWQVQIDGADAVVSPNGPHGLISVPLGSGQHEITIRYAGTTVQHIADGISISALMLFIGLIVSALIRRVRQRTR